MEHCGKVEGVRETIETHIEPVINMMKIVPIEIRNKGKDESLPIRL